MAVKNVVLSICLVFALIALACAYDDYILQCKDCILEQDSCDGICETIRDLLPSCVNDDCSEVSFLMRGTAREAVGFVKENHPSLWQEIQRKYGRDEL